MLILQVPSKTAYFAGCLLFVGIHRCFPRVLPCSGPDAGADALREAGWVTTTVRVLCDVKDDSIKYLLVELLSAAAQNGEWVGWAICLSVCLSLSFSHTRTYTHTHTHTHTHTARVLGIGYDAQWWALQWLALSTLLMVAERSKQLSHVGVVTQCRIFFFDTLSLSLSLS